MQMTAMNQHHISFFAGTGLPNFVEKMLISEFSIPWIDVSLM